VVVLIKELLKNSKNKLLKWVKLPSNMLGLWINLKVREKEVSLLIFPFGNLKPQNIISPLLMPQDTETLSKT